MSVGDSVPFLASEPGVPELLSDGEDESEDATAAEFRAHFGDDDAALAAQRMNASECHRALARLVQVKLQYADCAIERPDDWLVFDPLEADLVPHKKQKEQQALSPAQVSSSQASSPIDTQSAPLIHDRADTHKPVNGAAVDHSSSDARTCNGSSPAHLQPIAHPQRAVSTAG